MTAVVPPLHRHQLVRLNDDGWRHVFCEPLRDDDERACLAHWAAHGLPLVVTRRQHAEAATDRLAAGLAAPLHWQRRRIALSIERRHVASFDEFPRIDQLTPALQPRCRDAWRGLVLSLSSLGAPARVYGSYGWQLLSGLPCVRPGSDVDLWVAVDGARQADDVATVLDGLQAPAAMRLDGELVFPDGRAVAWREWRAWRAGRCGAILTKTLTGAALVEARAGGDPLIDVEAVAW